MPAWHGRTCLSTGVIRDNEPVVFFFWGGGDFFSSFFVLLIILVASSDLSNAAFMAGWLAGLQRIQYAKSKSDTVAKLDGTYKMPGSAAANVEMTETQQSIFNAPPPSSSAATTNAAAATPSAAHTPQGVPSRPSQGTDQPMTDAADPDNRGQKRPRDEEDSDEDVAMEEESDED